MDWNAKANSWDFSEFAQESMPNIHGVGGSSGFGNHSMKGDFSVDLKLGQVSNQTDQSTDKCKGAGFSKMVSASSGSSKRPRAANNGAQSVSCLVDGCNADLSNCREYHRRHKVCELHSKTAQVTIGGNKQRFCQQCSRFHSLDEFDEGKRSCRKRLDGHNRRRRKPQPDSLTRAGNFLSSYQGTQLFPFSNSHVYPSTAVGNHSWVGVVNTEAESALSSQRQQLQLLDKPNLLLGSTSSIYGGGKQFTFMQGHHNPALSSQTSPEASVCQALSRTIALSESGEVGRSMFCDRLSVQACNSDCALSLLSSPQMQTSGIGMNNVVHPSSSLEQPLGPRLGSHGLEPVDSVLVSSGSESNIHCSGIFHLESDGPQDNEAPQTLPFHWD